jgi:dihydroorotase
MKTLIQHAHVVLPTGIAQVSVLIENEKIVAIDPAIQTSADHMIDASGLHLLPGVIDDQVHFREPGLTHKEDLATASAACAKGGVTTYLEMPNTRPAATTQARLDEKLGLAAEKSLVNYGFYIGATPDNLNDLKTATRTPGIKIFIGSSTGDLLVDDQNALERIFSETTLPITAHCEDETTVRANTRRLQNASTLHKLQVSDHSRIRDHQAAIIATRRAFDLARRHQHRFHLLHLSTGEEVKLLADHGGLLTGEICLHHLLLNCEDYPRLGTRLQTNPAAKLPEDNQQLWQGLLSNCVQVLATDHAPHTLEEKKLPYPQSPSGMPNVENALALMLNAIYQGHCTLEQVVHWMCDAPARVWDIVDKGRITEGYDADLVLVDLQLEQIVRDQEQLTRCGWSAWNGTKLTGWPVRTWVLGREVYHHGQVNQSIRGKPARFDHERGGYWATV